jgi:ferric-dicitrate binding protein FerR (iron transport regulator)
MKSYADYVHFEAQDFLRDAEFRDWLRQPSPERAAFWRGLVRTHPHLKAELDQARLLALGLESTWTDFSDAYVDEAFDRLRTERLGTNPEPKVLPLPTRRRWIGWAAAACVTLLLVGGGWSYRYFFTEQAWQTVYGERRSLTLPDGSTVTLNANSRLRLPSRWDWRTSRQVWLDGEAYFRVAKQPTPAGYRKFTVHTNRLDVEVLGTRFNVYARSSRTQVLLDEGRVRLRDITTRQQLTMRPGQVVEYTTQARQTVREAPPALARSVSAYERNQLLFAEAPLDEVSRRFEDVYGVALRFEGQAFENQRFIGELPLDDLDKALLILSETFDATFQREGRTVTLVARE